MPSTIAKFAHLRIPLEDVVKATDNFHQDNIIGHGGPGTAYRGQLLRSERLMEITARRFDWKHGEGHLEFLRESTVLLDLKHTNLVSLIGFCDEKDEKIIVTRYEANGNLGQCLTTQNLTWTQRLRVCVGVARALSYLHDVEGRRDYFIIHSNINSDMILLDENWKAKLYGFEHSNKQVEHNKDEVSPCEHSGTMDYMDPAIEKTGGVTLKSDIYSLGIILFEVLCGRRAFINDHENDLVSLAKDHYENKSLQDILKVDLCDMISPQSLLKYSNLAYSCLNEDRARRPNIDNIVNQLEEAMGLQLRYENIVNNFQHLKVPLHDIKSATHNFEEAYGFYVDDNGCKWYRVELPNFHKENHSFVVGENKGEHPKKHNIVVIKRYPSRNDVCREEEFLTEIQVLNRVKHPNIATLLGFCVECFEMILVIDDVYNRFLGSYLEEVNGMRIFTWEKRLKICIDVAHALNYLHSGIEDQGMIINCDIRSHGIGLDEKWGPRIMGFEYSIFLPLNQEDRELHLKCVGRPSYRDPEYELTNKLKRESDVYGFGVVLFEILCGRLAFDPIYKKESDRGLAVVAKRSFCSGTLEEMIDPLIKQETNKNIFFLNKGPNKDSLDTFIEIAIECVTEIQDKRPSMNTVVKKLEKALLFQNMASTINDKFAHLRIPLEDVVKATNNFHHDNIIIRHGGPGTAYRGRLLRSERLMEITARRFDWKHGEGHLEFLRESTVLLDLEHTNLVSIIGFCDEKDEKIIVTMYEANGNLGQCLTTLNLTWTQRLRVCVGVARVLSYLHDVEGRDYSIIHCNINSDMILLDDNWEAKLYGFEHSIKQAEDNKDEVSPCEHIGTTGCRDPAIEKTGGVTQKSDIYSLGVILFEVLCGRRAFIDHENEANKFLVSLAKSHYENKSLQDILKVDLCDQMSPQSLLKYSNLAYSCLNEDRARRPDIDDIVYQLEEAIELQLRYENIVNSFQHLKVPLHNIKSATRNFEDTYSFCVDDDGCNWYRVELDHFHKENHSFVEGEDKGEHPRRHNIVVIKQYPYENDVCGEEEFFTEIETLNRVKHPNIVTLLGFCVESCEMILIIDNVSNGFLGSYLKEGNGMHIFTWEKRLKICIDVAHALNYLHSEMEDQKMIINRDIYSYGIGLDEKWRARIMGFDDSIFLPLNQEDEDLYLDWAV